MNDHITPDIEEFDDDQEMYSRAELERLRRTVFRDIRELNEILSKGPDMEAAYKLKAATNDMAWLDAMIGKGIIGPKRLNTYKLLATLGNDLCTRHDKIVEFQQEQERIRISAEKQRALDEVRAKQARLEAARKQQHEED